MARLTALKVKSLTKAGRYGDGDGLWLQVRTPTNRSWLLRYTMDGKQRQMGLGPLSIVSLADAREAARKYRAMAREGIDPIGARRDAKAARIAAANVQTFREVAAQYIAAHEAGWSNVVHRRQWRTTIEAANKVLGNIPVAKVGTGDVIRVLEPLWRTRPETASRLRGRIELVLDFAAARGWRGGDNPARWRGHLNKLLPPRAKIAAVVHQPALPWRQMGAFMAELAQQRGMGALALRFTILTAARVGEVTGARWNEIDMGARLWEVPAARMKARRPHRVPLSPQAMDVLETVLPLKESDTDPVFIGRGDNLALSGMTMLMALRRMSADGSESSMQWRDAVTGAPITVHGFRSTFRDWCAEATAYPRELAEMSLAHTQGDAVERAYARSDLFDRRRRLMEEWGRFCTQPPVAGEVVPIRA